MIEDQLLDAAEESVFGVGQVAGDLLLPLPGRGRRDPGDANLADLQLDDAEDSVPEQPAGSGHLDGDQVGCRDDVPVGLQEGVPTHLAATLRGGVDAVGRQDSLDGAPRDRVAESEDCPRDARVSSSRVRLGHAHDQGCEVRRGLGVAPSTLLGAVVLSGDQSPIPAQDRLGRDEACELL